MPQEDLMEAFKKRHKSFYDPKSRVDREKMEAMKKEKSDKDPLETIFRREHKSSFDPNSPMDRKKMEAIKSRLAPADENFVGNDGMKEPEEAPLDTEAKTTKTYTPDTKAIEEKGYGGGREKSPTESLKTSTPSSTENIIAKEVGLTTKRRPSGEMAAKSERGGTASSIPGKAGEELFPWFPGVGFVTDAEASELSKKYGSKPLYKPKKG